MSGAPVPLIGRSILRLCNRSLIAMLAMSLAFLSSMANPRTAIAQQAASSALSADRQQGSETIEAAFLTGLFLLDNGQPEQAIPIFLRILAVDPTLVRVRLELARAYYEAEQWSRAREEFFTVLSGNIPDPVRERVLSFIQAIDSRRGFDWDLTLGITTAGNSRQYDTDEIDLNFEGIVLPFQLDRPVGTELAARVAGAASYRRPLEFSANQAFDAVAFVGVDFDLIDARGSQYDDYNLGARVGARLAWPTTTVTIAPFTSTRFFGGERVEDRFGLEATFERRNLFGGSVFGFTSFAEKDSRVSDDRSGRIANALIGFRRSVGGRATVGFSIGVEDSRVDFDLEDYTETEARIFGSYDALFGLTMRPSVYYGQRQFRNPSPLFTESPDETSVGFQILVEKNDFFIGDGFSPFASLQYERTKSDIEAFSFTDTQLQVGLERRF